MDSFTQRKISILKKEDKSSKKSWDEKIIPLCNKINETENYYTTSSCSGKSIVMEEKAGKDGTYYLWTSHDLISLNELKSVLKKISSKKLIKFKSESPIIFVVAKDIAAAKKLLEKSISLGFKQSGIIITNKLIGVEIKSSEKIEFPIFSKGKILVSDDFLKEIISETNKKRKLGWKKINLLVKEFN